MFTIPESDFFDFIKDNIHSDISELSLRMHVKDPGFDLGFALIQIGCRQKTSKKLSAILENPKFLFPDSIAAEQSSHEAVALFHASLIKDNSTVLDMTAGLGIDAMTMAAKASSVVCCELDPFRAFILEYNRRLLSIDNLEVIQGDSCEYLIFSDKNFDTIFIDPARRDADNRRTYSFHDCLPDVVKLQEEILRKCSTLLIKASPLLDISQTLRDIRNVSAIRTISVGCECKEVLVETNSGYFSCKDTKKHVLKEAIDLYPDGRIKSRFTFKSPVAYITDSSSQNAIHKDVTTSNIDISGNLEVRYACKEDILSGIYLYEPEAGVMKFAPWKELCEKYPSIKKLDHSSHLFITSELYEDFPGRILRIEKILEKRDRKTLKGLPVNVVVRNYPLSAENLRKQLGVKEGVNKFIYGTRCQKPILIMADRL